VVVFTLIASALFGGFFLRVNNTSQTNYTIKMCRYAEEIKEICPDLGLSHIPNFQAPLQGTKFCINSYGLGGAEPILTDRISNRV
jgi:hypothetical protein